MDHSNIIGRNLLIRWNNFREASKTYIGFNKDWLRYFNKSRYFAIELL